MKHTYAAPVVTTRGDVVRTTLSGKASDSETSAAFKPNGGSNLSFGL